MGNKFTLGLATQAREILSGYQKEASIKLACLLPSKAQDGEVVVCERTDMGLLPP